MKRSTVCLLLALLASSLAGCVRFQDPNAAKNPLSLSEVTVASSVSPDGRPLASASSFLASTPAIFVSAKVNNAPENTTVGAKWVYVKDESGKTVSQVLSEDSSTARGTQYVSFSRRPATGTWGAGEYSVSLLLNGSVVASAPFTVQAVQKAGAQAPTISYFRALPEAISTGQAVTLSWSVSDATQVEISTIGLVAAAGNQIVVPVNSVEYQLTARNGAGTTTMKLNITVTSFNSDKPELVITDFRAEGDKAYYKIKNIGGATAKQSTTFLYVEGVHRASSLVDILPIGEERQQVFPNYQWTYGANRTFKIPVRVCADGLNQIGEYDENNNCLVVDW
jgi:hypothetical protein